MSENGQTVNFGLQHVTHIPKAIVPAVDFSYKKILFEDSTRRHIFANTVQWDAYVNSILHCVLGGFFRYEGTKILGLSSKN